MNGRSAPFSPISADGSEWSGISRYQNNDQNHYSPHVSHPRGNLATPPVSGSSNGVQGRMSSGMTRPLGNPSPPNSVARSSYGTTLSDHQRRKTLMMEESLAQHYAILKRYLAQSLRDEKGNPRPNRARDKLLRLSPVQFQELSTDVYDELLRRQSVAGQQTTGPGQVPSYLLPKDNFHPKRNQARQKLATLPSPRFRDLATDVFYELERRFPRFGGAEIGRNGSPAPSIRGPPSRVGTPNGVRPSHGPGTGPGSGPGYGPPRNASLGGQVMAGLGIPGLGGSEDHYGKPTAKTFQSNTIIPNKSTMVEDDDDQTGPEDNEDNRSDIYGKRRDTGTTFRSVGGNDRDRKAMMDLESQVSELQLKVQHLEGSVQDRDAELSRLHESQRATSVEEQKWNDLKQSLENKLKDAKNLNNNLHSELERVRIHQTDTERQLQSELDQITRRGDGDDNEWKSRYEGLNKTHQELQIELRQQQKIAKEVKKEAAMFLNEMKTISERSSRAYNREEELVSQVHLLEDQVKEWKNRYARARTQLRTQRTSSLPLQQKNLKQVASAEDLIQENGLVKDVHVTKFQLAIDDLLRVARTSERESLLTYVKPVVIAVREISQDATDIRNDAEPQVDKLKAKISATANNLITATKNFAVSQGLSPVSLVDAAASHLSVAVVALIRVTKICASPEGSLDIEEDDSVIADSPATYYGMQHDRTTSAGTSIYDTLSSPVQQQTPPFGGQGKMSNHTRNSSSRDHLTNGEKRPFQPKLGFGIREHDNEVEELKGFLEDQMGGLFHSIQSLLDTVRGDGHPTGIKESLNSIASIIGRITSETQYAMTDSTNLVLRKRADPVIQTLLGCKTKVLNASAEDDCILDEGGRREFIQKLPTLTTEVKDVAMELMQRLDQLDGRQGDFR
ncbi:MAG: hypothetical protein Q9214_000030 [Letrouitia sp. 1 TL-2023]